MQKWGICVLAFFSFRDSLRNFSLLVALSSISSGFSTRLIFKLSNVFSTYNSSKQTKYELQ